VSYLREKTKKKNASLVVLNGVVDEAQRDKVEEWAKEAMKAIYDDRGVKPCRRLLVFVNPAGGTGRAVKLYTKVVEPILQAAGCNIRVIYTERSGHAFDVVRSMALEYDAVVTVSGDGMIHEVLNGFADHPHPLRALSTPVAPIPAGSGNGLSVNLLGREHGLCASTAALNVAKGQETPIDLFSIIQDGKRSLSFMSQALGIMADLDLGTEHLRWMGESRFLYGLLRGIAYNDICPVQLSVKIAETDKHKMAAIAHARNLDDSIHVDQSNGDPPNGPLPPLQYLPEDEDGWHTIEEPLAWIYAGQGPYVSRDYMAFPVSLADDGYVDVSALPIIPRTEFLASLAGVENGSGFWTPKLLYFKAKAYRVKVLSEKGNLSIDGERFPFKDYQLEVHRKLGKLLTPHGRYAAEFKPLPGKGAAGLPEATESKST